MFLKVVEKKNQELIECGINLLNAGKILPDSYVIDVDTFLMNATIMLEESKKQGVDLYFMLKQVGRNPYLAKELVKLGYLGAVVVDFKEAAIMMKHQIPICNIGNLVQTPRSMLREVIAYKPSYMTLFSIEKLIEINEICYELGCKQKIMIKVYDDHDQIYSGQDAGIHINDLPYFLKEAQQLENCMISGFTSFPCFLYDDTLKDITAMSNVDTVLRAATIARNLGFKIDNINLPSATCTKTISMIKLNGGTSGEPGHGLSGTTPAHLHLELEEQPCVIYVSEISHHFKGNSYCYGGGYYRRSHVELARIGNATCYARVLPPQPESIDYYFEIKGIYPIGDPVIMAFRFQIFVTRSDVVLVRGIKQGKPNIVGVYDSLGRLL